TSVLRAAAAHEGTALVEIYQNCNIFNDGAFEQLKDPAQRDDVTIRLEHGQPIRFGAQGQYGVIRGAHGALDVAEVAKVGEDAVLVHDAHADNPELAFALTRLGDLTSNTHTPIGVFRDIARPVYDRLMSAQMAEAATKQGPGDLASLIRGNDTWTIA
ncbi:2-oxoacid:ferredoxin oxidoreductase subunit beta, partial [Embleya sp. NPDC056538]